MKVTCQTIERNGCGIIGVSVGSVSWPAKFSKVHLTVHAGEECGPLNRSQKYPMEIHYNVGKSVLDYVFNPEDFAFENGYVAMPMKSGLGIIVNESLVEEVNNPHR